METLEVCFPGNVTFPAVHMHALEYTLVETPLRIHLVSRRVLCMINNIKQQQQGNAEEGNFGSACTIPQSSLMVGTLRTPYSAAAAAWQSRSSEELLIVREGKGREEKRRSHAMKSGVSLSLHLIHFLAPFSRTRTRVARRGRYKKRVKAFGRKNQ